MQSALSASVKRGDDAKGLLDSQLAVPLRGLQLHPVGVAY